MNRKILTLTLLLAVVPGVAISASVYKWPDENGVTHFGDRQPTGSKAERVNVRSGTSTDASGNRQSPQERLQNLEERQSEEAEQRQESAVEQARRKQREANCATARSNLELIERNARIRIEENGEQRYLSQEEIAEKKAEALRIAEENCGPVENSDQQ